MVQRKFTLIYMRNVAFGDMTNGALSFVAPFYDMPLDYKIKKATLVMENDQNWSTSISGQITIRPGQPAEIDQTRDEDDILHYVDSGNLANSYTKVTWVAPDRIPMLFHEFGDIDGDEWESQTHIVNTYVKHTEHFVIDANIKRYDVSITATNPTTGDTDFFVILDCEVL